MCTVLLKTNGTCPIDSFSLNSIGCIKEDKSSTQCSTHTDMHLTTDCVMHMYHSNDRNVREGNFSQALEHEVLNSNHVNNSVQ